MCLYVEQLCGTHFIWATVVAHVVVFPYDSFVFFVAREVLVGDLGFEPFQDPLREQSVVDQNGKAFSWEWVELTQQLFDVVQNSEVAFHET